MATTRSAISSRGVGVGGTTLAPVFTPSWLDGDGADGVGTRSNSLLFISVFVLFSHDSWLFIGRLDKQQGTPIPLVTWLLTGYAIRAFAPSAMVCS